MLNLNFLSLKHKVTKLFALDDWFIFWNKNFMIVQPIGKQLNILKKQ